MGSELDNEGNSEKNFWKIQKESKHRPNKNENESGKDKNVTNPTNKTIETPNLINEKIEPRGLNNIGATCYMNSVLQCLYHIFDLSNSLLGLLSNKILTKENYQKTPMISAFIEVVYMLSFEKKPMSPYVFKEIISKNQSFKNYEANDSKNLTLYVLDTMNKEFNDNKIQIKYADNPLRNYNEKEAESTIKFFNENYNSIIGDLFNGLKVTDYICSTCKNSVKNYQLFNIINCSIEKTFLDKNETTPIKDRILQIDIMDCFKFEQKEKIFNGNNQIYCVKCNQSRDGISINKIIFAPKILILFLDRGYNNTFICDVLFPETLDINNYLEMKGKNYKLIGVIEHLGKSGETGHFIANCKHFDGNWYIFSDSSIYPTKNKYQKYGVPYLLFYRRED